MPPLLVPERGARGPIVQGFSGHGFKVDGVGYPGGLMLTPERAMAWDAPAFETVDEAALAPLAGLDPPPEFILLGTGATLRRAPTALVAALDAKGIGIEAMDSRAAARAWAVLRAEDRWITAALMPLG